MTAACPEPWREVAGAQAGLITRAQLRRLGVGSRAEAWRVSHERWQRVAPAVIATFTGQLTEEQRWWVGVLHGGEGALLCGIHALIDHGLRNWTRDEIQVLVPYRAPVPGPLAGYRFIRTRRPLDGLRAAGRGIPRCRVEPAALLWAARERSSRAVDGLLAAVVQQRLSTAPLLARWADDLVPLRGAARLRLVLAEIDGGAHSRAELDVGRMCRRHRIAPPVRQVKRRDSTGRLRYTDCEWRLPDGRVAVLEVDGGFHFDADQWEDDIARQRALASPDRVAVRCTARELRDNDGAVAADLLRLGVPRL